MNWSFAASPLIVLVGLLVLAGSAYLSFLNWHRNGKRKSVGRLECLRFVLIILLNFTLLRPEVVEVVRSKETPQVAVLVDRSGSMETRDVRNATNIESRAHWVD